MSEIIIQNKIQRFLDRKFRASRSFATKRIYASALKSFEAFAYQDYNQKLDVFIENVLAEVIDPIESLDDFYTYLTKIPNNNTKKTGLANATMKIYITVAKEFLNDVGCKIYSEDLRRKFRLPRTRIPYEEGITKELVGQILRLANYKLATVVLLACSGGMRLGEIVQLRLVDVDFTTKPTTLKLRAETTKTRETRITHISSESTKALQDYLLKVKPTKQNDDNLFLTDYKWKIKQLEKNAKYNTGIRLQRLKELADTDAELLMQPR
ncbi:MAG: site-specific integrase [Thaumarchaeota archaeon]|nr:site-specific integrase [Nitrososphaerota archaeon]